MTAAPGRSSRAGVRQRRRLILLEVSLAAGWCLLGFHLLADPMRRFEVALALGTLNLIGEDGVSGALGDAFIIFGPDGTMVVARLTSSCSSLASLLALSGLAFVVLRQRPQALLGLGAAGVWVVLANQVRLIASLLAGRHLDVRTLVFFHDWVGAILNFLYTLGGLLIMIALTMHMPERAEQDRSGRHTARRPDSWARPGLGYRVTLDDRPRSPRIRMAALVHRYLLPRRLSRWLGARRERRRIDYRIGHLDPERRAAAVRELAGRGLGVHTATLVAVATNETDTAVLGALADAVAARQWEPVSNRDVAALRLWARAWLMLAPGEPVSSGKLVAVTGAGGPAGASVIRALQAAGHRVLALDASPHAVGLRLATLSAVLPRWDGEEFGDELVRVVEKYGADALIVTVAEEYSAVAAVAERLGCATWLPPAAAVEVCLDKGALARALALAGVSHPPTADDLEGIGAVPGPWIVKPARGGGGRGVVAVDTAEDLVRAYAPGMVVQSRLSGREFAADALVGRDGTLLTCVPRWRDEMTGGVLVRGTTFDSSAVTRTVDAALRAVGLTGPANVQGFVGAPDILVDDPDAAVEVIVIGVEPCFSGGLPLTLAAGADVVGTYVVGVLEPEASLPRLSFQPGVRMTRYFAEVYCDASGEPVRDPLAAP